MKTVISLLTVLFLFVVSINEAHAQTMSNSLFKIIMGNLNSAAGSISGGGFKLNTTVGQTAQGLFTGTNYKAKVGFQYVRTNIPFSFSLSANVIDFGLLSPTNPVTRTVNLTVSSGSAKGFTVILSEDKPLTSSSSATIPDTACDNGDCSINKAASWTNSLSYGFGYRCDDTTGTNCLSGFSTNYYKPFPVTPASSAVMTSAIGGKSRVSQLTYKVNIAGSQAPGVYKNIVTYIASPGF